MITPAPSESVEALNGIRASSRVDADVGALPSTTAKEGSVHTAVTSTSASNTERSTLGGHHFRDLNTEGVVHRYQRAARNNFTVEKNFHGLACVVIER